MRTAVTHIAKLLLNIAGNLIGTALCIMLVPLLIGGALALFG